RIASGRGWNQPDAQRLATRIRIPKRLQFVARRDNDPLKLRCCGHSVEGESSIGPRNRLAIAIWCIENIHGSASSEHSFDRYDGIGYGFVIGGQNNSGQPWL